MLQLVQAPYDVSDRADFQNVPAGHSVHSYTSYEPYAVRKFRRVPSGHILSELSASHVTSRGLTVRTWPQTPFPMTWK